jgi:hypothetical protein
MSCFDYSKLKKFMNRKFNNGYDVICATDWGKMSASII